MVIEKLDTSVATFAMKGVIADKSLTDLTFDSIFILFEAFSK
jgi:hypothetical protein